MSSGFVPFAERRQAVQARHPGKSGAAYSSSGLTREEIAILQRGTAADMALRDLQAAVGKRYARKTLANFDATSDEQSEVVEALRQYSRDATNISEGRNVILYGSKGTGKDHLLMGLAHAAYHNLGFCPTWENGHSHFDRKWKQACGKKPRESYAIDEINAPIFWLSDPLPMGNLFEFQQADLFATVDHRYREQMPIWIATNINLRKPEEVARIWGSPTLDRLMDSSLVLECRWPSYRTQRHLA